MKISVVEREDWKDLFEHEATVQIAEAVRQHPALSGFVAVVVRNYESLEALSKRDPSLRKEANRWGRGKPAEQSRERICRGVEQLYAEFEPSSVRGVLIEAIIETGLRARYGGASDWLENNVKFRVETSERDHTTSTSIDVLGVDGAQKIGECHDCKARARKFDADWIRELVSEVRPCGFRIGLATADTEVVARHALRENKISLSNVALISSEHWGSLPPLQPLHPGTFRPKS